MMNTDDKVRNLILCGTLGIDVELVIFQIMMLTPDELYHHYGRTKVSGSTESFVKTLRKYVNSSPDREPAYLRNRVVEALPGGITISSPPFTLEVRHLSTVR